MEKRFEIDFMQELFNNNFCSIYEILLLHSGLNRNNCNISKEAVENSKASIVNKPLYAILNNKFFKEQANDFSNHFYGKNGEVFEEQGNIFGVIPESSPIEWIEKDGKEYLKVQAVVWKKYSKIINTILKNRDGNVKVSIEIYLEDYNVDEKEVININKFNLLSVTMLGKNVMEGIEGSSIKALKFSYDELNQKFITFSKEVSKNNVVNSIMNKYSLVEKESVAMSINELRDEIWNKLDQYKYMENGYEYPKYWIKEIYPDDKFIIVKDEEFNKFYMIEYLIEDNNVVLKYDEKKECRLTYVIINENDVVKNSISFNKKDFEKSEGGEKKVENEDKAKIENECIENHELENSVKDEEKEIKNEEIKVEDKDEVKNEKDLEVENKDEIKNEEKVIQNEAYDNLIEKFSEIEKELNKYKRKEEETEMKNMIEKFSHCMSKERKEELEKEVVNSTKSKMEELINSEVANFALSFKEKAESKKENVFDFSINPMHINEDIEISKVTNGIDNIMADKSVTIKGK